MKLTATIEWHSVKDELPDDDITVLVHSPTAPDPVWIAYHEGSSWYHITDYRYPFDDVTHWAHLPEPPHGTPNPDHNQA